MSEAKAVSSTELLACPFCGSNTPAVEDDSDHHGEYYRIDHYCGDTSGCGMSIGIEGDSLNGVIAAWNRRANAQISGGTPSAESDCWASPTEDK